MGLFPSEGTVIMEDEIIDVSNIRCNINKGIFLIPDDRKKWDYLWNTQ